MARKSNAKFAVTAVGKDQVSPAMKSAADSFVRFARQAVASQDKVAHATGRSDRAIQSAAKATSRLRAAFVALGAGAAIGAVIVGMRRLGEAMRENVELAAEQERAELRALAAIRQRGQFTQQAFEALQAFNGSIQQSLGIGDETLLQLQGTLSAMGILPGALQDATRATIGLSEATGQDLNSAARIVARALQGETSALTRYGISVDTTAEAQDALINLFRVAQAQSGTLSQKVKTLDANYGDLRETMGKVANASENAKKFLDGLNQSVLDLQRFFGSQQGKAAVESFFSVVHKGMIIAVDATRSMVRALAAISGSTELKKVADELYEIHKALELARQGFDPTIGDRFTQEIAKRNVEAFQEILATQEALRTFLRDASLEEKAEHVRRIAQLELEIDERRKTYEESRGGLQGLLDAERKLAKAIMERKAAETAPAPGGGPSTSPGAGAGPGGPVVTVRTRMIAPAPEQQEAVLRSFRIVKSAEVQANQEAQESIRAQYLQTASTVTSTMNQVFGRLFAQNQTFEERMKGVGQVILQQIAQQVQARIAQHAATQAMTKGEIAGQAALGGAAAGASAAQTPLTGWILAPIASAAVFALLSAFASRFQRGGMVPGSGRGDTVPALLEPGEYVVPRELTRAMAEGRPPRTAQAISEIRSEAAPARGAGAGPLQIIIPQALPSTREGTEQWARQHLVPILTDLGYVRA